MGVGRGGGGGCGYIFNDYGTWIPGMRIRHKLEFVDSDIYFVQDKNNFINPLLQVGSGSGSVEESTGYGSGSGGPKITGSDRIRILIPDIKQALGWDA